jgi:Haem-NO-binding
MKGIVFTEFLELVEDKFGLETVEEVISTCDLETAGSYTAIGTYDHKEMFQMVSVLSKTQNISVPELLTIYGEHFFGILAKGYPQFLNDKGLFAFLESIDNYIHPQVLKLYPDAELPSFRASMNEGKNELLLVYQSIRAMSDFAVGLIQGASKYYGRKIKVEIVEKEENGQHVTLKVTLIG